MVVNDDAGFLIKRGVLKSIASKLAPTGARSCVGIHLAKFTHCNSRLSFEQLVAHDARFFRFWVFLESVCNSDLRLAQTFHAGLT
jgi:hypothetical protein